MFDNRDESRATLARLLFIFARLTNLVLMKRIVSLLVLALISAGLYAQDLEYILKKDVEYLCNDRLQGRKAGSDGERQAAMYIHGRLTNAGVTMLSGKDGDKFSVVNEKGDTVSSRNVIGIIEGYDPRLREEYIVVGARLDHLGTSKMTSNGRVVTQVYPGADASASGAAALCAVAEILAGERIFLRRSIIFVAFGASEEEFAGSRYFLTGFSDAPAKIKMMLNLDMLGSGNGSNPFRIFSPVKKSDVQSTMAYILENESVTTVPTIGSGTINPSDYIPFHQQKIPAVIFSTGISKDDRTIRDVPALIDYCNLAAESIYIAASVKSVAQKDLLFPSRVASGFDDIEPDYYAPSDCDVRPKFFHNSEAYFLEAWVYKYLKYPDAAVDKGIQGIVNVSFIIETDGRVTNVKVEKSVHKLLDDEAVKVVSVSPKWSPGEISKKKVRTKVVIPVEFRLTRGR